MAIEISYDELLAALEEAQQDDDGMTAEEIAKKFGHTTTWAREAIRKMVDAPGVKVIVGRKAAKRIDGVACQKPCYRFVKEGA